MPSHSYECVLPDREGVARWALEPAHTAIVFVHGYRGHYIKAWNKFPRLLTRGDNLPRHDLLFFKYDSKRDRAIISAKRLRDLLRKLHESATEQLIQPSWPFATRASGGQFYDSIVLVAHSFGAIVARLAVFEGHRNAEAWVQKVRLALFAPAHHGHRYAEGQRGLLGAFFIALLNQRSLIDVDPKATDGGVAVLNRLGEAAAEVAGYDYLWAQLVRHTDNEDLVNVEQFFKDDPFEGLKYSCDHEKTCKPRDPTSPPFRDLFTLLDP
ncbi:MAG: esterase/lipase family protein [Gemmatimonadales bacterium]